MSKVILVMDMPKNCLECPIGKNMSVAIETCIKCPVGKCAIDAEAETIPKWCPLKELPQKQNEEYSLMRINNGRCEKYGERKDSVAVGWNKCIDEILRKSGVK